ncbi:MAG: hypothetical protein HYZ46_09030 [Nitrosomonadales bacterium]|nr:hypothetical protein [Nitrosomonadales bacterium]
MADAAQALNADGEAAKIDRAALGAAIHAQGAAFQQAVSAGHEHLFSDVALFVTAAQVQQMRAVIAAVEEVVASGEWSVGSGEHGGELGVFYGYDFHLNAQGAHLIEINSNAGGAFLNALLIDSQRAALLPGTAAAEENLEQVLIAMFRREWCLVRGDTPLNTVAIVDEQPVSQYLYPEFLLAQQMLERAGITAHIVDPSALQARDDGLYCAGQRIDLVYNRLTDFDLRQYPQLRSAWEKRQVVLTPNPAHYRRYADKRKLALLSDGEWLRNAGVSQASIAALLQGVPQTRIVSAADAELWWAERKQWFFKPASGYGSKGAYRGDKLTRRVFEEIMLADYVAQRLAVPGERVVAVEGGESQALKYDVRCYVYDGQVQLVAARLYQGQTTNFRTPGGGFAVVRVLE